MAAARTRLAKGGMRWTEDCALLAARGIDGIAHKARGKCRIEQQHTIGSLGESLCHPRERLAFKIAPAFEHATVGHDGVELRHSARRSHSAKAWKASSERFGFVQRSGTMQPARRSEGLGRE